MNAWIFRHLDRLAGIYGGAPGASELPLAQPVPTEHRGTLEPGGQPLRGTDGPLPWAGRGLSGPESLPPDRGPTAG